MRGSGSSCIWTGLTLLLQWLNWHSSSQHMPMASSVTGASWQTCLQKSYGVRQNQVNREIWRRLRINSPLMLNMCSECVRFSDNIQTFTSTIFEKYSYMHDNWAVSSTQIGAVVQSVYKRTHCKISWHLSDITSVTPTHEQRISFSIFFLSIWLIMQSDTEAEFANSS